MNKQPQYISAAFGGLWLWSGLQPVLSARNEALRLLADTGLPPQWQMPALAAASAWDVLLGLLLFSPWRQYRLLWAAQAATIAAYTLIVALRLPANWLHPFAPLVKNFPLLAVTVWLAGTGKAANSMQPAPDPDSERSAS
ncbi:MAG: DoxX-like family protein [Eikenella sp.]|nr:DoxX-like family protein [Eikenella sp.]